MKKTFSILAAQISYFHGCYANYNYPQLGKDFVAVMNAFGIGVQLIPEERCCGVAKIATMKTAALFQKAWRNDPKALPLDELLSMATINGARALGLNTGRLAEGALADISIVDTDNSFFLSPASFLANFVYSAHSSCIDSVICGGKFVMRHREIEGEKEILAEARKQITRML